MDPDSVKLVRRRRLAVLLVAAGLGVAFTRLRPAGQAATLPPLPTENRIDRDDEERQHELRMRWIEEMHRTPPGVSWREIERENGERLQRMRNEAAGSAAGA